MLGNSPYHVLIKAGDASAEVERVVRTLGSAEAAGVHGHFFVQRADQTVVMALGPDSPISVALRGKPGWTAPGEEDGE